LEEKNLEWERREAALRVEMDEMKSLIGSSFICIKDLDDRVKALAERVEVSGAGTQESPFEIRETPPPSSVSSGDTGRLVPIESSPPSTESRKEKRRMRRMTRSATPRPSGLLFPAAPGGWSKEGFTQEELLSRDRPDLARLRSPTPTPVPGPSRQTMEVVESLRAETLEEMEVWLSQNTEAFRQSVESDLFEEASVASSSTVVVGASGPTVPSDASDEL